VKVIAASDATYLEVERVFVLFYADNIDKASALICGSDAPYSQGT